MKLSQQNHISPPSSAPKEGFRILAWILPVLLIFNHTESLLGEEPMAVTYRVTVTSNAPDHSFFPEKWIEVQWMNGNIEESQVVKIPNLFMNYKFSSTGFTFNNKTLEEDAKNKTFPGVFYSTNRIIKLNTPLKFQHYFMAGTSGCGEYWYYIMPVEIRRYDKHFVWEASEIVFDVDDDGVWYLRTESETDEGLTYAIGAGGFSYFNRAFPSADGDEDYRETKTPFVYMIKEMTFTPYFSSVNEIIKETPGESGQLYDLTGRRILNPAKGIYIRNGKKVVL